VQFINAFASNIGSLVPAGMELHFHVKWRRPPVVLSGRVADLMPPDGHEPCGKSSEGREKALRSGGRCRRA
jgi:hypothetical protein